MAAGTFDGVCLWKEQLQGRGDNEWLVGQEQNVHKNSREKDAAGL